MRIGLVPVLAPSAGGIYQYSVTMIQALHTAQSGDEFVVFSDHKIPETISAIKADPRWSVMPLPAPRLTQRQRMRRGLLRIGGEAWIREARRLLRQRADRSEKRLHALAEAAGQPLRHEAIRPQPEADKQIKEQGVELMIYPAPQELAFEITVPYVMAVHDLQHRLQPEFLEVSAEGAWESREYLFRNGTRRATLLLADSEVGREDIFHFYGKYGVAEDRVKVLPFLPASYLSTDVSEGERQRVRRAYHLPERYLFYPAQFWPHKNHRRIIEALALLRDRQSLRIPVVFCGSHKGGLRRQTFREVSALASHLHVRDQMLNLDYIPDQDMSALYAEAEALVMPTFFGPTNIPVLEAWAFGCPVLSSNIRGIREQIGEAGVLVDPRSSEAIAEGISRLWTDQTLQKTLADQGRRRLNLYTPADFQERLSLILEEAKRRIRN